MGASSTHNTRYLCHCHGLSVLALPFMQSQTMAVGEILRIRPIPRNPEIHLLTRAGPLR